MLLKPKNLIFIFIFACLQANAQTITVDSLRAVISSTSVLPQKKLEAYVSLSSKISLVSFNETIRVAEEGLLMANKLNDSLAIAELNRNIGIASYFKGDYEKAATQYYNAIGIYERKNKNKELANVYNDLAKLYRKTRDLKRALDNYNSSYTLYKLLNDSSGMQMI
jgi:tetratricopeptide (TPR) repeat protein